MNSKELLSDFELDVAAAMAVPDAAPQFVTDFRKRLLAEAENLPQAQPAAPAPRRMVAGRRLLARPTLSVPLILFALLTLTTLIIGPKKVWAAVQRLFGYVPGIGYVQTDGGILVLDETVTVEREGITVSVEQVVVDTERTTVLYKVEGLSLQAANSQGEGAPTGSLVYLRLSDGTELFQSAGGGDGWGIGYRSRSVFEALPQGVDEIVLVIPRLQSMPAGAAPENWEIPLQLKPAEGEVTLLPVYEIEQTAESTEETTGSAPADTGGTEDQIAFSLARVVELDDGFQFEGTVTWLGADDMYIEFINQIDVVDANGARVPAEMVTFDDVFNPLEEGQTGWAVKTVGKSQPGPWTITLSSVFLRTYPQISFQVDLGDAPQVGQTWEMTHTFNINGQSILLNSIKLIYDDRRGYGLEFAFNGGENLVDLSISDPAYVEATGSIKGWGERRDNLHISGIGYDEIPTGVRTFSLDAAAFISEGSWQVSWDPPESAAGTATEPVQPAAACMFASSWLDLQAQPPALLDSVVGNLLLLTHTDQMLPEIRLASPEGTQLGTYGTGAWISLSPDGSTIAVPVDADGIHLIDVATGADTLIPNTFNAGYPIWSPDGTQIAFLLWDQASIFRINLDGSGLSKVYQGNDLVYLSDWTPVGNRIIYLGFGEGGMAVRAVGVESGQMETLILTIDNKPSSRPSLSPDGEWIIYIDQVEGDVVDGIYAARLDGSERRLLMVADDENIGMSLGVWSPDGQWVVLNVRDFRGDYANPLPVLVNVNTCEVVPLFSLSGEAVGWRQ